MKVAIERARRYELIGADDIKIGVETSNKGLFEDGGVSLFFRGAEVKMKGSEREGRR